MTEEIRAKPGMLNISEKIREARWGWLGHMEGKMKDDVHSN